MFLKLAALFISALIVHNILLSRFLGCCPFLGVSNKLETAKGMGIAVIFVTTFAAIMTWLAYTFILVPMGLEYLYTLAFILIIAALLVAAELLYFRIADRFNIIDKPNARSSHSSIVLRGGGGPNYGAEHIAFLKVAMKKAKIPPAIIPTNHSKKLKSILL